jgi:hypothetical protein
MTDIIITAVLSFLAAFFAAFILWRIQRERFSVEYDLVESDTFPRENGIGTLAINPYKN